MGIILYSPTLATEEKQNCFDCPDFLVMTMDDYRHWRNDNNEIKNAICFLPMNVQIDLALRQYYTAGFQLVKPEQGKTVKAPYHTLVCKPLTEMEKFYLFNYYNGEVPQFSSKTMNEFITQIQKARYYLAKGCLNPPSGKINSMYNIADFYDNKTLQNELEFPLDRDQNYNSLFASYRIRRHISDELSCFKADLFIASHGEVVGRFYHFTEAPKQTKIRLNTQTRLNLVAHNFNKTVLGTFVNLPTNFQNRYTIPDGGHLGHTVNQPAKTKTPTVVLKSSILDITSPNRNRPVYKLQAGSKTLDLNTTTKSNFDLLKPKNTQNSPTKTTGPKHDSNKIEKPLASQQQPVKSPSPQKSSPQNKTPPKETDNIDQDNKNEQSQKSSDKDSSPELTLHFTSSSNSPIIKPDNTKVTQSHSDNDSPKSPEKQIPISDETTNDPKPKTQKPIGPINKIDKHELNDSKDSKNSKNTSNKSKDSSTTTTSTTYSAIFQPEQLTFIANDRNRNPNDRDPQTDYDNMHNVTDTLTQLQIDFKNQLENLMLDYQRSLDQPQSSILPDPSSNTSFLNDINQLVKALENNTRKANEIRTHVLEAIFSIVNQHFRNPNGPLNPDKISLEHINSGNFTQRQVVAYLDNMRDAIIKIKPPTTQANINTPLADKKLLDIANNLYETVQPLVQSIYEQFEKARTEVEQNIRTTNLGLSKELVPVKTHKDQPEKTPHPDKTKKAIYRRKKPVANVRKPLDDYYYPSSDEKTSVTKPKIDPQTKPKPKINPQTDNKTNTKMKTQPGLNRDENQPVQRRLRSHSDNPSKKSAAQARNQRDKGSLGKKTTKIPVPKISIAKNTIPKVPDSLHAVCSPTQEGMPPLEEIKNPKTSQPKSNKRVHPNNRNLPKQKRRKKENRFQITDSSEEV